MIRGQDEQARRRGATYVLLAVLALLAIIGLVWAVDGSAVG